MDTVLMVLSVLAFTVNNGAIRGFQVKCSDSSSATVLFQAAFCAVGSLAYLVSAGFKFDLNGPQALAALTFGAVFGCAVLFCASAFLYGPMSISGVIGNCSVVIPVLYSCILLKEAATATQLVGFGLMIVTFVLSALQSRGDGKEKKKANFKWLLFSLGYFATNGTLSVIQKNYKLSDPESDGNAFMCLGLITAAAVLLLYFCFSYMRAKKHIAPGESVLKLKALPLAGLLAVVAGLGSFGGNWVVITLSAAVPAAVLYPFVNGGICVGVSLASMLVFREKLTWQKAVTILVGLAAVIVLNL